MSQSAAPQFVIVFNPNAGAYISGVQSHAAVQQVCERHLAARGITYAITTPEAAQSLADIARAAVARGVRGVVAAGGDGTISRVASGLVQTGVPLGILPIGTANVLAQELRIPLDLDGACRLLADAHALTRIDAMRVGKSFCFLNIGVGLDAQVMRQTPRAYKRRFGLLAFVWTTLVHVLGHQPYRFNLAIDGKRRRIRAAQVLLANGGMLGIPLLRWGPGIALDDGRLNVCVVSARTLFDYLGALWHILLQQHCQSRQLRYFVARESITITASRPLPVQGDGEPLGETPLRVRLVPGAVQIITPLPQA